MTRWNRTDSNATLYANSNRYRPFGADTLSYDLDGNMVSRSGPGPPTPQKEDFWTQPHMRKLTIAIRSSIL